MGAPRWDLGDTWRHRRADAQVRSPRSTPERNRPLATHDIRWCLGGTLASGSLGWISGATRWDRMQEEHSKAPSGPREGSGKRGVEHGSWALQGLGTSPLPRPLRWVRAAARSVRGVHPRRGGWRMSSRRRALPLCPARPAAGVVEAQRPFVRDRGFRKSRGRSRAMLGRSCARVLVFRHLVEGSTPSQKNP